MTTIEQLITDRVRHQNQRRSAFTVLELLIVISIIAVLIGLLVPVLAAARESARNLQCQNNLRQIGVTIQLYHGGVNRLPEAWKLTSDKVTAYGWSVALLPYLDGVNLPQRIDYQLPLSAGENDLARNTQLVLMNCPSDISEPMFELLPERSPRFRSQSVHAERPLPIRLPSANYLGVFGTLEADETFPAPKGDGSIVSDRVVRFSDLQRGQSKTLLVGERTSAMAPSTWFGVNFRGEDAACRLVGSAITSPNCKTCDECEFASRHSGGANFLWADGHVSLVADKISSREYQQMSKRRID